MEAKYSELGQNALHPKLMLCIIFLGYMVGIRSGRKLAQACGEQLPFIYLSKGYHPKQSSINDFRKDNYTHFEDLFLLDFGRKDVQNKKGKTVCRFVV